ncbi:hypothetical protein [Methylocella silvestris]|uniref:hypothetical protein n=1 Tax=Methylocella silvestris TaxID=199596 RepID=UPI0011AEE8C8|nr:hypothetical protein [Methylocella silvestris]
MTSKVGKIIGGGVAKPANAELKAAGDHDDFGKLGPGKTDFKDRTRAEKKSTLPLNPILVSRFCLEVLQRSLVPRRFDLFVHPQYGIVGGLIRTLDLRAFQDRNAFARKLLLHQGRLKRFLVGANLLQFEDGFNRRAAKGGYLGLVIGRLRRSEGYSKDRFHDLLHHHFQISRNSQFD